MFRNKAKIGLALSGGGMRAAVFHLGVMKFLAQRGRLEEVRAVSTVSGGSFSIGLILSVNGYRWPTSEEYLQKALPSAKHIILSHNIETALIGSKVKCLGCDTSELLAEALHREWGISGNLQDLPSALRWEINSVTFETAENFRFSRALMGDPELGYAMDPPFPLPHALAASAAYPVLIGTYKLDMRPYQWYRDPLGHDPLPDPPGFSMLWDGGVYDNLGLWALYRPGYGLAKDIDFIVASDASAPICRQEWSDDEILRNMLRIWDIKTRESDSLLLGGLFRDVIKKGNGMYIKTGAPVGDMIRRCHLPPDISARLAAESLTPEEVAFVRDYPTNLLSPTQEDFDLILRHGYETALAVIYCGNMA